MSDNASFLRFMHVYSRKHRTYQLTVEELLKRCTKDGCLLLDAGCGKGVMETLIPEKYEVVGIDVARSNILAFKLRWKNCCCTVADITRLPFRDGMFGGILSINVLEHVDDKNTAIRELARVTCRKGFFVGSSTNIQNPMLWLDVKVPLLMRPFVMKLAPGHYERRSRFSPSSLRRILSKAGYRLDYLGFFGVRLFSRKYAPWVGYFWVFFDRVSERKPFLFLKEMLVWQCARI